MSAEGRGQRAEGRWCASLCVAVKGAKRQIFGRGQCCAVEGSECCERAVGAVSAVQEQDQHTDDCKPRHGASGY